MEHQQTTPTVKPSRIWLPVAISVGVSAYLISTHFNPESLTSLTLSKKFFWGIALAFITVFLRDLAYMKRIRVLTQNKLSWWVSLQVILLWEFGSAITPGAVGGIALALYLLRKEGISYGQTTAIILVATILDNLAFVSVFTALFVYFGKSMFSVNAVCPDIEGHFILSGLRNLSKGAVVVYAVQILITLFLVGALFVFPQRARNMLYRMADFYFLKKVGKGIKTTADDLLLTSKTFSNQPIQFWFVLFLATLVAWISRYALVNGLVYAFLETAFPYSQVFARQYVLWTYLILPSTPGASGLAELSFIAMNCEFFPQGTTAAAATVWRMFNYYIYIILGIVVLPKWLKRVS